MTDESRPSARVFVFVAALLAAGVLAVNATAAQAYKCMETSPFDCQRADVSDLDLAGRSMIGANFTAGSLTGVSFDRSELSVALFDRADLEDVSFAGADLKGASFAGATFNDVSFRGADLTGARFENAQMDSGLLEAAFTCLTTMPNQSIDNSDC